MMKKLVCLLLAVCLLSGLLAACGGDKQEETLPAEMAVKLGETGVTVTLPTELGFEQMGSELNEFFGVGANGEWSIIVNTDEKGDYVLDEYAELVAQANNADKAQKDADGNYYFTYKNEGYQFYTAIREVGDKYYRVAFYCFSDVWNVYAENFAKWASTIEIN